MAIPATPSPSAVPAGLQFDPGSELHAPDLYRPTSQAFQVETLADIGPAEVAFYREQGYLAVRQAFSAVEVAAAVAGLEDLVMGRHPGFKDVWFEAAAKDKLDELGPDQRLNAVRKLHFFVEYEPRLRAMSHDAGLIAVVTRLMGGRAPVMFQDMALLKPPRIGREKPWHQDHAYFDYPLDTPIVGVWIALDEATVENGCMQMLPGRHREPMIHFQRRDWQLCDKEVLGQESVAAPLPPGGLLLFDGKLPHGTPHNTSAKRRRALQYHYRPADAQKCATEVRLDAFGSEGKDVSC